MRLGGQGADIVSRTRRCNLRIITFIISFVCICDVAVSRGTHNKNTFPLAPHKFSQIKKVMQKGSHKDLSQTIRVSKVNEVSTP
jgi:hypothetical protein